MQTVGIDLGTTNTLAAVDGRVLPLSAAEADLSLLPSVVAYPPSGFILVGAGARRRRTIDPENTLYSTKRVIGRRWHDQQTGEFRESYPHRLIKTAENGVAFETRRGVITPEDVAATVVSELCGLTGITPGAAQAVVSVPAGFSEQSRTATVEAVSRAGFADVVTLAEPLATFLAYFTAEDARPGLSAIYDLGGGTFDLAIVDCRGALPVVVDHGGDLFLGGDDVDRALASWAAARALQDYSWDLKTNADTYDRLVMACEQAKARLCYAASTRIDLASVDPAAPAAVREIIIDRSVLEIVTRELVQRTFSICDDVLSRAGLTPANLDSVFLAGGGSHLPAVRRGVELYFGRPPRFEHDPLDVVAAGASVVARVPELLTATTSLLP